MKFCATCGAPADQFLPDEPVYGGEADQQGGFGLEKLKKFMVPAIIVVAALAVAFVAFNFFLKPSKYQQSKGSIYISQFEDEVIIIGADGKKTTLEGRLGGSVRSLDGTKAAVLIRDEDADYNEGGTLYYIDGTPRSVADGVVNFQFAISGKGIAYAAELDDDGETAELWLYSGGKTQKITSDLNYYGACCISPDGKIVGYTIVEDEDKDDIMGYIWDGKAKELGKNKMPVMITNGTKYVYYVRNEENVCVQQGLKDDTRVNLGDLDSISGIFFNSDLTELIYNLNDKSYISRKGSSKESLSGSVRSFIIPSGTGQMSDGTTEGDIYNISSFSDTFYLNRDGNIIHIDGKFETDSLVKSVDRAMLAKDGKTLTYMKNDNVYKLDGKKAGADSTELTDDDIVYFTALADGSAIYYVNEDYELYYQKGTGKPVMVSDDIGDSDYRMSMGGLFKGSNKFFFVSDEELYVSTGAKGTAVSGIDGEIKSVSAGMFAISVTVDDDGDEVIYRSTDGTKFEAIGTR